MTTTSFAPSAPFAAARAFARGRPSRARRASRVRASSSREEEVYIGKGRWVVDDPRRYASRDDWFTGGWPGGEVGLKEGFIAETFTAPAGTSGMMPAADARRGARGSSFAPPRATSATSEESGSSSSPASSSSSTPASREPGDPGDPAAKLKFALFKTLATLDRGVASGAADRAAVRSLVESLEATASAAPSSLAPSDAALEAALDGEWRLAYSSTFAGEQAGSQGFVGAPGGAGAPLGSVYQRISAAEKTCDNVVQLGAATSPLRGAAALGHAYVVSGRTTTITFTGVTVEEAPFGLPAFKLPSPLDALPREARDALEGAGETAGVGIGSGAFETTFVDADARISRGDRGELRVFVKTGDSDTCSMY